MESCVCLSLDGEGMEIGSVTTPIARKHHFCNECNEVIYPGEVYERAEGKWEGDWRTYKTCNTCKKIRDTFLTCGFYYTEVWTDLYEAWSYDCENKEELESIMPQFWKTLRIERRKK